MKEKKRKPGKNGGFYIALCGCAVVVALMSYVGNMMKGENDLPEMNDIALNDIDSEIDSEFESYEEEESEVESEEVTEPEVIVIESETAKEEEIPEEEIEVEMTAAAEEIEEFMPALPVSGKVLADFSGENLVFYEGLEDWRTHPGIDLEAKVGDDVYLCEDGVVEKIYSNNMGGCILIDHQNGYKSLYANLGEIDLVNVGDRLYAGETIARVGETAVGDYVTEPHVHFELHHEGKSINPLDVITIE